MAELARPLIFLKPPYYAVIFSSRRTDGDEGYGEAAARMLNLASQQPGYLGVESVREGAVGITISYWESEAAIAGWKANLEHLEAQAGGRARWYSDYEVRVAKVERVTVLQPGTSTPNGTDAIRQVVFRPALWGTVTERVTAYDAHARTFSYTLTGGLPGVRDHLGTLTVTPHPEGSTVEWAIWFEFNPWIWGLGAGVFVRLFSAAIQAGLDALAEQADQDAP